MSLKCDYCSKIFESNTALYHHKQNSHSNLHDEIDNVQRESGEKKCFTNSYDALPPIEYNDVPSPAPLSHLNESLETKTHKSIKELKDYMLHSHQEQNKKILNFQRKHEAALDKLNSTDRKAHSHDDTAYDDLKTMKLLLFLFNWNTMREISVIQELVRDHQIDRVVEKHFSTLKKLFLCLTNGILPMCTPQRNQVTFHQQEIVERIPRGNRSTAIKLLRGRNNELVSLFRIIEDTIKLAHDSLKKFGPPF